MEQKININVSSFVNCIIIKTNQNRESTYKTSHKKFRDVGVPLGKPKDFSLWYLEFKVQSLSIGWNKEWVTYMVQYKWAHTVQTCIL